MSVQVRRRREAAGFLSTYVGAQGELLVDTTNNRVLVQDGATPGGFAAAKLSDLGGRNRIINGNFAINQRGYASGRTLAAGAYAHDRWRDGGAGGLAYTFNQGTPDTAITITAGQSTQTIEPSNVAGGTYVLSWVGTIGMSVGYTNSSGQSAAVIGVSPLVAPNVGPGSLIYVETIGTGTLGLIQFEAGTVPTSFERRQIGAELALCQRYYERNTAGLLQAAGVGNQSVFFAFKATKRATPTTTVLTAATYGAANSGIIYQASIDGYYLQFTTTQSGGYVVPGWTFDASAEL